MYEYLNDIDFLERLDTSNFRTTYAKLILLSFDEKPLKEIQGRITTGSMNVNGSSAIRRTISLTMIATLENTGIANIDNEISIDKKVQIFIGLKNPFKEYIESYGEIIWFPMGVYILSSAKVTRQTNGWNIAISGKDKMCRLDGTCGGRLFATTGFHEKEIENEDGTRTILKPTIFEIIFEAVNHLGEELVDNIIIQDIDDEVKLLVKYVGANPIYFNEDFTGMRLTPTGQTGEHIYSYGQDVGYRMVPFSYPGELILKPGDTVVTLLDKIKNTLGNYEYYYDVWGHFIFKRIKNYLDRGSPLEEMIEEDYTKSYNNAKYLYDLTKLDSTVSITSSPNYDNIGNDFYVWGQRGGDNSQDGYAIRYHLAIDKKPLLQLAKCYMWKLTDSANNIYYEFNNDASSYSEDQLIGKPCNEWREELYRQALVAQVRDSVSCVYYGTEWSLNGEVMHNNAYDAELLREWRKLYDTLKWDSSNHWNPNVTENPAALDYWLDFIDSSSVIGSYSVNKIGRRTKVDNDTALKTIYNKEVPDIVFIDGYDAAAIERYTAMHQQYFVLTEDYSKLFVSSSTAASCFDRIREMMYQNLSYNTSIQFTCLPKFYMEPNNIMHIEDKETQINGNYQITQFNLPLTYNGTMTITATEVLTRV